MYQYRYIAFNICSCRILIISYKVLITTGISYETTNELTIYAILCQNVTIFYRQKLASLFQVQEQLKACSNSKWNISSSCFTSDDCHVQIPWLHVVAFTEHDILHFWENAHLLKYYLAKEPQITALILLIVQIKQVCQFPDFRFP